MSLLRQVININKTTKVGSFNIFSKLLTTKTDDPIQSHIGKLVKNNKIVVFMKGEPQAPRCGFSNAVIDILSIHKVKFDAHDVLRDENLRNGKYINKFILFKMTKLFKLFAGIKEYSNWPTIPQVFVNGEFIGGCDIMLQLHKSGELDKILEKTDSKKNAPEKPVV